MSANKVAKVLREQAAVLERTEQDAPRSAADIIKRHGIKELAICFDLSPYDIGRAGYDALKIGREEAAHNLARALLADCDFQLTRRGNVCPDFGLQHVSAILDRRERDTYGTSIVAISPEKLRTMLQEAFRAGRGY